MAELTEVSDIIKRLIALCREIEWTDRLIVSFAEADHTFLPLTETHYEKLRASARQFADQRFDNVIDAILLTQSLSDDMIKELRDRMDGIVEEIRRIYTNPGNIFEIERHADICRRDLCWSMFQIRHHNGGVLPPDLDKEWNLNTCSTYKFHTRKVMPTP